MSDCIITEEMRYRQQLCKYALKHGVAQAARKYHTNRQFVYRQLAKYDGDIRSLALKSRKPHNSPRAHTEEELELIKNVYYSEIGLYGLAGVYVKCQEQGYTRSYTSMCRQIRNQAEKPKKTPKQSFRKHNLEEGQFVGDKVQIDIKYVPQGSIKFMAYGKRYYQITAIDEFSRKRVLTIVEEKSTFETGNFLLTLEEKFGFPIHRIQVDNGTEFVTDPEKTDRISYFQEVAEKLGYEIKRIRPYSPWQNGKVERSHREDERIFYSRNVFTSKKDMLDKLARHEYMYNNTPKVVLGFKTPNEVAEENKEKIKVKK